MPDTPGDADAASLPSTLISAPDDAAPINLGAPLVEAKQGLERYALGATLGRGGMGEVRLCRDLVLHRALAMKLVTSTSPGTVTRFVREARVQGQLEHPGIVPVHDLGLEPGGRPYFTMKRVRGVTLAEVLRALAEGNEAARAKYPRRRLLQAFQAVCLTVDFAHSRHVVHRDLKPANVMLGDFGEVYVLDWGIAKHLDAPLDADAETLSGESVAPQAGQTAQGAVMGTPGYMSPEQALGEPVDPRTDVYALGAAARALADPAASAAPPNAEQRRAALRELGQALAIDPGHPGALRTLVQLLGASRGEVPAEARAELASAQSRQTKAAGRLVALVYLSLFLYLPVLVWMGVRDAALLGGLYGLVLLSAGASLAVSLQAAPRPAAALLPFAVSTALIAWVSVVLGPFVFLPSFAATNAIAYGVLLERRHRVLALGLGALAVILPVAGELLGLLPNPHAFSAAGLTIAPQAVALREVPSLVLLTVSSVGTIVFATLAVTRLRDALREAEARLVSQAWTLRQLLPPSATAATTGERDLRA
jgi:hypothetical protein